MILPALLLASVALAAEATVPAVDDDVPLAQRVVEAQQALVDPRIPSGVFRRVGEEGLELEDGPMKVVLRSGWMVPIMSGSARDRTPEMIGFAWVGQGEVTVRLEDRADAVALANRLVRRDGADPAEVEALARREAPLTASIDRGVFLSIGPELRRLYLESDLEEESSDPLEVTIYGDREGPAAAKRAARVFKQRHTLYGELELGLDRRLAWDLAARAHGVGPDAGSVHLMDVRTDLRFGHVGGILGSSDQWIATLRDETGHASFRFRAQVVSMGRNDGGLPKMGRLGGHPFPTIDPEDPTSPPAPPVRLEPDLAETVIRVRQPRGMTLPVEIESRLTLRAIGGPVQWTTLELPRVEAEPRSWELLQLTTADGVPVVAGPIERIGEHDGDMVPNGAEWRSMSSRVQVVLPEPVREGETVDLVVRTVDAWPFGGWIGCGGASAKLHPAGPTTGLQPYLPAVGDGWIGAPWRVRTEVAVPVDSGLQAAVPGQLTRRRSDGEYMWTSGAVEVASSWPRVALGDWAHDRTVGGAQQLPITRVRLHTNLDKLEETLPATVRQVAAYLEGWLPPGPTDRVQIIELPKRCLKYEITHLDIVIKNGVLIADRSFDRFHAPERCTTRGEVSPVGVVTLQRYGVARYPVRLIDPVPHYTTGAFAHQLAHQHWGHLARPAHPEDFWIAETFAELFSCMVVGAAHGPDACAKRMDQARARWQRPDAGYAPLTAAYTTDAWEDIVWLYGPYVMLEMLRPRLGNEAFFLALDVLLRDHPHEPLTTERLQHYFEQASGQDLQPFFDLWVHQGFIPSLALEWTVDAEGRVEGVVTSDLPFGTIDVPVLVKAKREEHVVMVDVVDGRGTFRTEPLAGRPKVRLDPDGRVLTRSRQVTRRDRAAGP